MTAGGNERAVAADRIDPRNVTERRVSRPRCPSPDWPSELISLAKKKGRMMNGYGDAGDVDDGRAERVATLLYPLTDYVSAGSQWESGARVDGEDSPFAPTLGSRLAVV